MFSHKPKIYRSSNGCCICRAKSSSSRFTDSKKYEDDFGRCFRLNERRTGEICNACVLLIKRWKKLPSGSDRNWHHVVDARAGPGNRSFIKRSNKSKLPPDAKSPIKVKKHKHRYRPRLKMTTRNTSISSLSRVVGVCTPPGDVSEAESETFIADDSPLISDDSDDATDAGEDASMGKNLPDLPPYLYSIIDFNYWTREETCCGTIFRGLDNQVLVDPRLLKPCYSCSRSKTNAFTLGGSKQEDLNSLASHSSCSDDIDHSPL